jgi:translation initiation factor 1
MRKGRSGDGGLVYSTQHGEMCPDCGASKAACTCRQAASVVPSSKGGQTIVRVGRETAGRKGKGVTVVTGVPFAPAELEALCVRLKKRCGSGGTVKDGVIEIQGDHRDTLVTELTTLGAEKGWAIRRAGG